MQVLESNIMSGSCTKISQWALDRIMVFIKRREPNPGLENP
jgi:hypothetical protein